MTRLANISGKQAVKALKEGEFVTKDSKTFYPSIFRSLNAPESDIHRKWMAVTQRRLEELRSGQVKPIPGEQVFARVSRRFIAVMHLHRDPGYWKHRLG